MAEAWGTRVWLGEVRDWVAEALSRVCVGEVGELVSYSVQPWSTVWTAECGGSRYWLKANRRARRREGVVQAAVAGLAPEYVDVPVAVEPARGWILTRDGGAVLWTALANLRCVEIDSLAPLVADYARLQRRTVGRRGMLASAGVREASALVPDAAALEQASHLVSLPEDDPRRITEEQYGRVLSALPALRQVGKILAAGPVPSALDQGDLWPGNIFCPIGTCGYRFFDFADAVWGHPFASLVMLAVECVFRWEVPQPEDAVDLRDDRIREVFDSYLRQWTDLAPIEELRELAGYALRTASLNRAAAWLRNLEDATADDLARYGRMPWAWLEDVTKPVLI